MATAISSSANSRIKEAKKLQRRRQRHTTGKMLIEGIRLVADAVRAGVRPSEVFYTSSTVAERSPSQELIAELVSQGVPCFACTDQVFAALSATVAPQGIAAVVPLPALPLPDDPDLVLILDRVRDPGNAGTLLRTAEAAGVDLVVFGPETVDPFNDKVVRAGMGAHFRMPLRWIVGYEEMGVLLPYLDRIYVADAGAKTNYTEVDWRLPTGLVVGGEASGASAAMYRRAHPISIPMCGSAESLNAAIAGAVILFEAARQRRHTAGGTQDSR